MSKRRLGKGIDALLQGRPLEQLSQMSSIMMVSIDHISPNPEQPRKSFNEETLRELADSIREKGIIQPIIAEDRGDGTYIIVAGERRYRAARLAGLDEVPVISQDFTEEEKLEIALIENIQREDLNPIDEAKAIQHAMEQSGVTQDQLAKRLGKSRSAIANALRLLNLDEHMRTAIQSGILTAGHARALLALDDPSERRTLFDRIKADHLSVRAAELAVKGRSLDLSRLERQEGTESPSLELAGESLEVPRPATGGGSRTPGAGPTKSVELERVEQKLIEHFGAKVVVKGSNEKGRLEIEYLSMSDLERVCERMGVDIGE